MPAMELTFLRQRAVLWARSVSSAPYDAHGQLKVQAPVEIPVRWNNAAKQMPGPEGNPITVDATVIVKRDVDVGSIMWEGTLADWYGTGSEGEESTLMEVVASAVTLDLKGRVARRELGLRFFRDTLPAQV